MDSRRAFVTDAKTSLAQYDEHIKRISSKAAMVNNSRKQLLNDHNSRFSASANAEASRGNDDFVQASRQSAMALEAQQDLVMDDMSHALDRLHGIGTTINEQLEESKQYEATTTSTAEDMQASVGHPLSPSLIAFACSCCVLCLRSNLAGLDDDLDRAKLSMDNALRKMEKLLKSSDKGRLCLILILFILAVGLFFGIVYG